MGRLLADKLSSAIGQPVTIRNVPGKSGTVGVAELAKAEPDGHTLVLSGDAALTTATVLYEGLAYDPKDLEPISRLASAPNAIMVPTTSPYNRLDDLIKAAKDKPGPRLFGARHRAVEAEGQYQRRSGRDHGITRAAEGGRGGCR